MTIVESDRVRRPRVTRDVAEANVLAATIELIRELGPEKVTVRDIARRCGHNQRFVVEWFGSKVELFRRAYLVMVREIDVGDGSLVSRRSPRPELVTVVRLMNWLVASDPNVFAQAEERPLIDAMVTVYRDRFGLGERQAELMAQRIVAAVVATILFGDVLRMSPEAFEEQIRLEIRLAQLLAIHGDGT